MARNHSLGSWILSPAVCKTVYPEGGGNHDLHISVQPRGERRDGYIAERLGVRWYITRQDNGGWDAQLIDGGVARNHYWAHNYASRAGLLMHLEGAPFKAEPAPAAGPSVAKAYTVRSDNFDYHQPIEAPTYGEALEAAKARGFEATITHDGERVAGWSPVYGTRVYNRAKAG